MPNTPTAWKTLLQRLPPGLQERLCLGDSGKLHLSGLAAGALAGAQHGDPLLARLGLECLLAAWESAPLDQSLAAQLLACNTPAGFLPAPLVRLLEELAAPTPGVEGDPVAEIRRLLRQGDEAGARSVAAGTLQRAPLHAGVLELASGLAPGPPCTWGRELLEQEWPTKREPLRRFLLANALLLCGDAERAQPLYAGLFEELSLQGLRVRQGECLKRLGRPAEALPLWLDVLREQPWRSGLALRAADLATGVHDATGTLPGNLAILLYTCGKDRELATALEALLHSELQPARDGALIVVLNNGDHQATRDCVAAFQQQAPGLLEHVALPVNVGAPAARNWLSRLESVRSRKFAAYLDDDAVVPADWLGRLAAAVQARPQAGVWGCKVVDAQNPALLQSVDLHLQPEAPAAREKAAAKPLAVTDLQLQEPDFGQFDYLRPCVSVTGCCHLFRTRTLLEDEGFDIRFSPTQFDDLDHDLRLFRQGQAAVYQGHLRVAHLKSTGEAGAMDAVAAANAYANMTKLQAKHPPAAVRDIRRRDAELLLQDLQEKHRLLASLL